MQISRQPVVLPVAPRPMASLSMSRSSWSQPTASGKADSWVMISRMSG